MSKSLTAIAIKNLRARPERFEVSDLGCPGLRVVVFPSGHKSFIVRYRSRGARQEKLTLGPCLIELSGTVEPETSPQIGTPLSLAAARALCAQSLREARAGKDPAEERRRRRKQEGASLSDTLEAVAQEFLRRRGPELRTVSQRRADLELLCRSPLGRLPIAEISRGQYIRVLDHIADHNGPVRSDRCLSALKTLLLWHAERSDYVSVLGRGGRRTSISERARDRTLSDDELRRVWVAAGQTELFGDLIKLALLTGARRSEIAGLRHSELTQGETGTVWTIPSERHKTKTSMVIPLSKAALKIIMTRPRLGDFVFTSDGNRPIGGFDTRKAALDRLSGVAGWTIHDTRRTVRTLLSRCGIDADTAERCLTHKIGGVRAHYDFWKYEPQMRHAFEVLATQIQRIVNPPTDVVTPLRGRK
jgi:integrase